MYFELILIFQVCFGDIFGECYWISASKSGEDLECLPDHYIDGACESGLNDDCKVDGILGSQSAGIHCCPSDRNLNFEQQTNCVF